MRSRCRHIPGAEIAETSLQGSALERASDAVVTDLHRPVRLQQDGGDPVPSRELLHLSPPVRLLREVYLLELRACLTELVLQKIAIAAFGMGVDGSRLRGYGLSQNGTSVPMSPAVEFWQLLAGTSSEPFPSCLLSDAGADVL